MITTSHQINLRSTDNHNQWYAYPIDLHTDRETAVHIAHIAGFKPSDKVDPLLKIGGRAFVFEGDKNELTTTLQAISDDFNPIDIDKLTLAPNKFTYDVFLLLTETKEAKAEMSNMKVISAANVEKIAFRYGEHFLISRDVYHWFWLATQLAKYYQSNLELTPEQYTKNLIFFF